MKVKYLLFLISLILSFSTHSHELIVVSDLDETLRMANVEKAVKAGAKLIGGVRPYYSSQIIFNEIKAKNPETKFYYLSNSYPFLYDGARWLKKFGFPEGVVFQRSLKDKSTGFKQKKLSQILKDSSAKASWIFFGDNIEHDPDFYRNFLATSGISDAQVYIRDAKLIFPLESEFTYFQHEVQILDDLNISDNSSNIIKNLPLSHLVPHFLLKNLKQRLIKQCRNLQKNCKAIAEQRVEEVISLLKP